MLRNVLSLSLLAFAPGALLLLPARAEAQACLTCRTDKCPGKTHLPPCTPPKPVRRPVKAAPRPAPEPVKPPAPPPPQDAPAPAAPIIEPPAQAPTPPTVRPIPPVVPLASPQPAIVARRPAGRGPLWAAGWTLLGLGVLGVGAGAASVAVDGTPTCDIEPKIDRCPEVLNTMPGGAVALAVGGAAVVSGVVLLAISARSRGRERGVATVALMSR